MQVKEAMTRQPHYLTADATIREVVETMRKNKTGFEPLTENNKVTGVLTDRDIALRVIAENKSLDDPARSIATEHVLYTFEDSNVEDVIQNMVEQQVQRLLVLNNGQDKSLVGVITLGDIADHCSNDANMAQKVVNAARHYH